MIFEDRGYGWHPVAEFRVGEVAHAFGGFPSGDTRLGPHT